MIVDDEPRHRMGLVNLIRRLRPDYIISEARNGADALDLVSRNSFDIIITDIKMPIMDGLEFIEHLGNKVKGLKIIILSAFGYFEYAQKAMNLGAFDYLLKPVDEDKVVEMLVKIEDKIKSEQLDRQERESLKKQLDNTLPVYLELLLNKWVLGRLSEAELGEIESIFPCKGLGTVLVFVIENFKTQTTGYNSEELREIQMNIKYWIKETLNPLGHSISFFEQEGKTRVITILNTSSDFDMFSSGNKIKLEDFNKNLKICYGFDVVIGVSNNHENIFNEVICAFREACLALENKFYLYDKKIIPFSILPGSNRNTSIIKYREEEEIVEAVRTGDNEKVRQTVDVILGRIIESGYTPAVQLKDHMTQMLLGILKNVQGSVGVDKYEQWVYSIPNWIREIEYFDALKKAILEILSGIMDAIKSVKGKKSDILSGKCLEHIEEHFTEDISLETIAEEFHFNPSYFSFLFKSKTGINFSQYLLDIRLKKGKELLGKTDKKVYEIAHMVGYKDPKYFNRVFKKAFGITPDEYRRI